MYIYICTYKLIEWLCIIRIIKSREKTPNNMMFETATPQNYLNRIVEGESQPQIHPNPVCSRHISGGPWELSAWFQASPLVVCHHHTRQMSADFLFPDIFFCPCASYMWETRCHHHLGTVEHPNHLGHFDLPCAWRRVFHGSLADGGPAWVKYPQFAS